MAPGAFGEHVTAYMAMCMSELAMLPEHRSYDDVHTPQLHWLPYDGVLSSQHLKRLFDADCVLGAEQSVHDSHMGEYLQRDELLAQKHRWWEFHYWEYINWCSHHTL